MRVNKTCNIYFQHKTCLSVRISPPVYKPVTRIIAAISQRSKHSVQQLCQRSSKPSKRFAASVNARTEETPTGGTQTRVDYNRDSGNSNMMTYAIVGGAAALAGYWWFTRTKSDKRDMKERAVDMKERARETTHDAAKRVENATKK